MGKNGGSQAAAPAATESAMPPPSSLTVAQPAQSSKTEGLETEVGRLNAENELLKKRLYDSQDEVNRLKGMIESQDKKSFKSDSDSQSTGNSAKKSQSRYWTDLEHTRFLEALQAVGPKDFKGIAQIVGTRNATQARTHAQKYFLKLARMKKGAEEALLANGIPGTIQESWLQHVSMAFAKSAESSKRAKSSDASTTSQSSTSSSMRDFPSDRSAKKAKHKRDGTAGGSSNTSTSSSSSDGRGASSGGSGSPDKAHREEAAGGTTQDTKLHPHMGDANNRSPSHREWHTWPRKSGTMQGLVSSSNEESGATDGSSTHGNGTSHGSYSGSNQSYSNSLNSANNSGNDNDSGSGGNDNDSGSLKDSASGQDSASNDGSNSNDDSNGTPEEQGMDNKGTASSDRMSD